MSRLLFLLPSVPWPLDAGARIRNHGLLRLLAQEHSVDAIAFGRPASEAEAALASMTRRRRVIPEPPPRSRAQRAVSLATSPLPDLALRRWSSAFGTAVAGFLRDGDYDAVQAEGIEMAAYLAGVPVEHRIYDAHNAEFLLQRRFAQRSPLRPASLYSRLQWRRLERFERGVVQRSRMTLAVSNHDANQLLALAGAGATLRVIPNAIDARAYPFTPPTRRPVPELLFVGKLDFRPNADALSWFVDQVLSGLPEARLFAVGAEPPRWLIEAGQHDDRIAVTGYVADERPYLQRCLALVLPLRQGGGSRLKALIALASGLPIVSTRLGMEGLEAEPDVHFLAAESPVEWRTALRRLAGDLELRVRLAQAGRRLVEQAYDWQAIAPSVRSAYDWLG